MLTVEGATALQRIGVISPGLSGQDLTDFLRATAQRCPKCRKVIVSVVEVSRKGKYGQVYRYVRLRHSDARKKRTKRAYCYVSVKEPGA